MRIIIEDMKNSKRATDYTVKYNNDVLATRRYQTSRVSVKRCEINMMPDGKE